MRLSTLAKAALAATFLAAPASAQTLRIQTHFSPETDSGKLAAQFVEDVTIMSGGDIDIEMFYGSSVVKSAETFDAAINGVLDCDMTGGAYQTGKNPAFQFVGDIMGGYNTPWEQYSWLYHGGGFDAADELYGQYNMKLIGWWVPAQESLSSIRPLSGPKDLKNWKFRSPPGLETEIFKELGASPIVMDFNEIFNALETGIIDGADASNLANNVGLGLYDIAGHATFPGFHSMPSDHLACRVDAWDGLGERNQRIMSVAMQKLAFRTSLHFAVRNLEAKVELEEKGIKLWEWSSEDREAFRRAAQAAWQRWADRTSEARSLVDSHVEFMTKLGLL